MTEGGAAACGACVLLVVGILSVPPPSRSVLAVERALLCVTLRNPVAATYLGVGKRAVTDSSLPNRFVTLCSESLTFHTNGRDTHTHTHRRIHTHSDACIYAHTQRDTQRDAHAQRLIDCLCVCVW